MGHCHRPVNRARLHSPRWKAGCRTWVAALFLMLCPLLEPQGLHAQVVRLGSRAPQAGSTAQWPADTFAVICYHDVRDDRIENPDAYTVESHQLTLQFEWLRAHGYHVISLDDVIAARRDHRPLPERAVLLSFDDGLKSVYTRAFPVLQAFHYPAIVGLVGSWLEGAATTDQVVHFGDAEVPRSDFLSAEQIREMQSSGLIEFGSHTYALHEGIPANPQGNLEPAAVARRFNPATGGYEDQTTYAARVREDLTRNSTMITALTGTRPRVMVWPYGSHNQVTDQIAAKLGLPYGLTLELGLNTPDIPLSRMRRILITQDFTTADLAGTLEEALRPETMRVIQVDLDFVYDPDPRQQETNLSALLDRVKAMGVNTVFLQAFADPDGSGTAQALYFPNRRMPMRADLFNRVAWQLRTRTGVAVYAWLPLLAFNLPDTDPAHGHWVEAAEAGKAVDVKRLSPFDPLVQQAVRDIYQDLSDNASFQGLLFSDDATLNDFEDSSGAALATYRQWGLPADVTAIRSNPAAFAQWGQNKISYLTRFSLDLARLVREDHDNLRTARNLFARVVTDPEAHAWFGQSMADALLAYDHVALMAMPYLEQHRGDPTEWLIKLVADVAELPRGLEKTVFEIQTVDWAHKNERISASTLAAQLEALKRAGAENLGYYPDDFLNGYPSLEAIKPVLSLKSFPGSD